MIALNSDKVNKYRLQGYRPVAVGCFVSEKRVLMLYKDKYRLWQFPQGGIENLETPKQALIREMNEELGQDIASSIKEIKVIGESRVKFPQAAYRQRELKDDHGQLIFMKGKYYLIFAVKTTLTDFDISQSEFNQYVWADYDQASKIAESIYQGGKKRVTVHCLKLLKEQGYL